MRVSKPILLIVILGFILLTAQFYIKCNTVLRLQKENETLVAENKLHAELIDYYAKTEGIKYVAGIDYSWDEVYLLARLIHSEAGSQSLEAKQYVASVVLNRMGCDLFPGTLHDVIYQDSQFSVTFLMSKNGVPMIDEPPKMEDVMVAYNILKGGSVLPSRVLYFWDDSIDPIRGGIYKKVGNMLFAY